MADTCSCRPPLLINVLYLVKTSVEEVTQHCSCH